MAPVPDPYRTLGLTRDASLDEVKRAYRRLAKEHHPDSGGERALPRFLEIQAAYEQLVGTTGRGRSRGATPQRPPAGPWQADEERADATRRAYGSRSRRTGGRTGGGPRAGARGAGPSSRAGTGAGTGSGPADPPRRDRPPAPDRPPNKATFGSTTYDGAAQDPFEPDWTGASWYGTSSGTYWTLNPREYADPRKHGPEYQARARRARAEAAAGGGATPEGDEPPEHEPADTTRPGEPPEASSAGPTPGPSDPGGPSVSGDTRPAGSWWTAPRAGAGPGPDPGAGYGMGTAPEPGDRRRPPPGAGPEAAGAVPNPIDAGSAFVRRLIEAPPTGPGARLGLALAGGTPLSLGLVWLFGEVTGCGRFAATCDPALVPLAWLVGLAIVGLLALVPRVASIATVGSVAMALAAVPTTIFLSATGGAYVPDASSAILGVVLAAGWIVGVGYASRRRRRVGGIRGPVS